MFVGIYNANKHSDTREHNGNNTSMVIEFNQKFKSIHGVTDCMSLINCEINTEEGRRYREESRLTEKVCEKCVSDSVRILQGLMEKPRKLNTSVIPDTAHQQKLSH